jgi:hypothetical protein
MASKFAAFFKALMDGIEKAGTTRAQTYLRLYGHKGYQQ